MGRGENPVSTTGFFFANFLRAVAQGLARLVRDQEIGGSNPLGPIIEEPPSMAALSYMTDTPAFTMRYAVLPRPAVSSFFAAAGFSVLGKKYGFSQSDGLRGHLDHFIFLQKQYGPLEGHGLDRRQRQRLILQD